MLRCAENPLTCSICTEEHPTLLHEYHNKMSVSSVKGINNKSVISLCVVPVMLCHSSNPDFQVPVYAMLDECSQGTFIENSVLSMFSGNIHRPASITVQTLNGTECTMARAVDGLIVSKFNEQDGESYECVALPTTYRQESLPFDHREISTPTKISRWSHLREMQSKFKEYDPNIPVGVCLLAQIAPKHWSHVLLYKA